jgi:hypothetical protein
MISGNDPWTPSSSVLPHLWPQIVHGLRLNAAQATRILGQGLSWTCASEIEMGNSVPWVPGRVAQIDPNLQACAVYGASASINMLTAVWQKRVHMMVQYMFLVVRERSLHEVSALSG